MENTVNLFLYSALFFCFAVAIAAYISIKIDEGKLDFTNNPF